MPRFPLACRSRTSRAPAPGQVNGQNVTFDALERLAPRADAVYRIKVRGMKTGRLPASKFRRTAETLDSPVTELESTKVYQD